MVWSDVPGSTFSPVRHGLRSFAELVAIGWGLAVRPTARTTVVTPLRPAMPTAPAADVRWHLAGDA